MFTRFQPKRTNCLIWLVKPTNFISIGLEIYGETKWNWSSFLNLEICFTLKGHFVTRKHHFFQCCNKFSTPPGIDPEPWSYQSSSYLLFNLLHHMFDLALHFMCDQNQLLFCEIQLVVYFLLDLTLVCLQHLAALVCRFHYTVHITVREILRTWLFGITN